MTALTRITRTTLLMLVISIGTSSALAQIHVPADHPTIQQAIDAASDGEEIIVAPGTYNEAIDTIGKAIHLRSSNGPETTIIDGTELKASVVTIASAEGEDTIIEGFTVTGGIGTPSSANPDDLRGGGMFINATSPTIIDCIFTENDAARGGGMFIRGGGAPNITGSTFVENTARDGGAIQIQNSEASLVNCTFANNVAEEYGGAIFSWSLSHTTIEDCLFDDNAAGWSGGALYTLVQATFEVTGTTFRENSASSGGAIFNDAPATSNTIHDSVFEGNVSEGSGGAIRYLCGDLCQLTVTESVFQGNAASSGGAVSDLYDNNVAFADTLFCENDPDDINAKWKDLGGNEFLEICPIPGDLNGDGVVDILDLLILLSEWGECDDPDHCPADLTGPDGKPDGVVDVLDMLKLLANWG